MIVATPEYFPVMALDGFDLGDPEGKTDALLESCLCEIPAIREFLLGKKDIVLGERGTGKTALFRLLATRKLNISAPGDKKSLVLPLDENIEYKQVKDLVENRISYCTKKPNVKYQFLWEIFITYKMLELLEIQGISDDRLSTHRKDISVALGFEKPKVGLMEFLLGHKKSVGVKLDNLHPTSSTFFISAEPAAQLDQAATQIDLQRIKRDVSSVLDKNNCILFVLLDRLDEFVILEDYDTQKLLLEGLVACYRNFSTGTPVKIKLFVRTDLFNRLNIGDLGADKIIAKSIKLSWRPEDLRELVARRLTYNILEQLQISEIKFKTDEGTLHLDPRYIEQQKIIKSSLEGHKIKQFLIGVLIRIQSELNAKLMNLQRRERKTNYNDKISAEIISLLFPNSCDHLSTGGKVGSIRFVDFIATHLNYSTGYSTPRITISFFEKCLHEARTYYSRNRDITRIRKNSDEEYELVKVECITRAYNSLKDDVWSVVSKAAHDWERKILDLRGKLNAQSEVSYKDFVKLRDWSDDNEPRQFVAFLMHAGVLSCQNISRPQDERTYTFPIMFRDVKLKKDQGDGRRVEALAV